MSRMSAISRSFPTDLFPSSNLFDQSPEGQLASIQRGLARSIAADLANFNQIKPFAPRLENYKPESSSWWGTVKDQVSYFGSGYLDRQLTIASTVGTGIPASGRAFGDSVGTHWATVANDWNTGSNEEWTNIKSSAVGTVNGLYNAGSYVYNNPGAAASAAFKGTLNYLDRLTTDPTVAGQLFTKGLENFAIFAATAGTGNVVKGTQTFQTIVSKLDNVYDTVKRSTFDTGGKLWRDERGSLSLPRFDGPKPSYSLNPAHVPGTLRPGKTVLPNDAAAVYKNAVPESAENAVHWFGKNADGQIYRYANSNDGKAHFSGIDGVGDGIRNLTDYAKQRLEELP